MTTSVRTFRPAIAGLLALLSGVSSASANVLDWLLPQHDVQMIAVTDTTPAAALRRTPTKSNPVYYLALNSGYHDFGGIMAGQDTPPTQQVLKTMVTVLAKQGYLPTTKAHPPSLILIWAWGTMNTDSVPSFNPQFPDHQTNHGQLLKFLGGDKVGLLTKDFSLDESVAPGAFLQTPDMEWIDELAREDLYVVAIRAYDFDALRKKEKVLLWTTKISCPSRGLSLTESLPSLMALAGPYIGRETPRPVSIRATDHYRPDVKIGDPKFVEYLTTNPISIVNMTTSTSPKATTEKK